MAALDRKAFYASIRKSLFGGKLTADQTKGIDSLLDAIETYPVTDDGQIAYIMAGVFHETGELMVPVREGFAKTDRGARQAVAKLFAAGKIKKNYALPVNGQSYYGRGRIQNTHLVNYQKLEKRFGRPFVAQPDLLLDDDVDARVTVAGHMEGIWTGKKLPTYVSGSKRDFLGARRVVNGTDRAALIAGYAEKFLDAVQGATSKAKPVSLASLGGAPNVTFDKPWIRGVAYPELNDAQLLLKAKGYYLTGNVDGFWGSKTRNAITAFRQDNGLAVSAHYDRAAVLSTIEALSDAAPVTVPAERALATADDVAPKSVVVSAAQGASLWSKIQAFLGIGGTVGASALAAIPDAQEKVSPVQSLAPGVPGWVWIAAVIVMAGGIGWAAYKATHKANKVVAVKVDEYRAGGAA